MPLDRTVNKLTSVLCLTVIMVLIVVASSVTWLNMVLLGLSLGSFACC